MEVIAELDVTTDIDPNGPRHELLKHRHMNSVGAIGPPDHIVGAARYGHIETLVLDTEVHRRVTRDVRPAAICSRVIHVRVVHLNHRAARVGKIPQVLNDPLHLVIREVPPPPPAVGPRKGAPIVGVTTNVGVELTEPGHAVSPCEHPDALKDVEEGVGVPFRVKEHPLLWVGIRRGNGAGNAHHFPVSTIGTGAEYAHLPETLCVGIVDVPSGYT